MTTDTLLIEKREELKRRLSAGEYKTLVDVLFDWMSRVIQKITRNQRPVSPWFNGIILSSLAYLITFTALFLMGDVLAFIRLMATLPQGTLLLMTLLGYLTPLIMVVGNLFIHRVFTIFNDSVLDTIELTATLDDFTNWLTSVCNRKLQFVVSLVGGVLGGGYVVYIYKITFRQFLPISINIGFILIYIFIFLFLYLLFNMAVLSARIGQYHLKLYTVNPSNSETIGLLANIFSKLVYLVAIYAAFFVFVVAFIGLLVQYILLLILLFWIPLTIIFIFYQTSLASIVRRAKWKTLNEIQSQVEELRAMNNLKDKETMEAINRLMDFHDRVKGTRNSAIDSGTILNFINSLLLPLIAFLLGNLDKVLLLFTGKP